MAKRRVIQRRGAGVRQEGEVLASRAVFKGRVFSVTRDRVREPGGIEITREVVRHAGSAVILPRRDDGRVLLVRQFRLPVRRSIWELAAGRRDPGETPLRAARRELEEETGLSAERWKLLGEFYPSPGYVDERMWLFLAQGLREGQARPEDDERIRKRWFTLDQLGALVRSGGIQDAKTLIGYFLISASKHKPGK